MTITLPPQFEKKVSALMKTGRYASASEVMAEALRFLEKYERVCAEQRAELEADLVEGAREIQRGETVSGEEVYRQLKERMDQRRSGDHA